MPDRGPRLLRLYLCGMVVTWAIEIIIYALFPGSSPHWSAARRALAGVVVPLAALSVIVDLAARRGLLPESYRWSTLAMSPALGLIAVNLHLV